MIKQLFLFIYLLAPSILLAQNIVVVKESKFAAIVDENSKEPESVLEIDFPGPPPLFFWTLIEGTEEAWKNLERTGKLPIRHRWDYLLSIDIGIEGELVDPNFDLKNVEFSTTDVLPQANGDGTEVAADTIRKLRSELDSNSEKKFDFRTWTSKKNLTQGVYKVSVFYNDNTPVLCEGLKCQFTICVYCSQ